MKKVIAIVMCLTMLVVFSSCTVDEANYLKMLKQMITQEEYTFEGLVDLKINKYIEKQEPDIEPANISPMGSSSMFDEATLNFLKESSIAYDGAVSVQNDKLRLNLDVKNTTGVKNIVKLKLEGKDLYIHVGEVLLELEDLRNESSVNQKSKTPKVSLPPIQSIILNPFFLLIYGYDLVDVMFSEEDMTEVTIDGLKYYKFNIDDVVDNYGDFCFERFIYGTDYDYLPYDDEKSEDYNLGASYGYEYGMSDGYYDDDTYPSEEFFA